MATNMRDELRHLIDGLPDEQLPALLAFAQLVSSGRVDVHVAASPSGSGTVPSVRPEFTDDELAADPMLRILATAPEDNEPLSADEAASVEEGVADYGRGDFVDGELAKRTHVR